MVTIILGFHGTSLGITMAVRVFIIQIFIQALNSILPTIFADEPKPVAIVLGVLLSIGFSVLGWLSAKLWETLTTEEMSLTLKQKIQANEYRVIYEQMSEPVIVMGNELIEKANNSFLTVFEPLFKFCFDPKPEDASLPSSSPISKDSYSVVSMIHDVPVEQQRNLIHYLKLFRDTRPG